MPKSNAVWGIDIGQCALKAVRCEPHADDPERVIAREFDYVEYPKILSQPDADPAELVREALQLFLSRNTVKDDSVAISVSGQTGLARFIKLPPVESKKIAEIVKYEARQQIPFSLEDVVWDYQEMPGGSEEEGFVLETEVGLFAMKRDQVFRALKPFNEAGIEVDYIQLAPLAIYNAVVFDQMNDLPPPEEYDPENPPESVVVLSLGTDNTDLVVTNGYRVWQRNIPLGGSHFTKALSKELNLTFAKAEHLKRNATEAEDPKAVFQAMRPVFNDLLTEVQRSIGYFLNIDKTAKVARVVALGNAMKLPGLQRFLSQNLGYDVVPLDAYRGMSGSSVVEAPAFKENQLAFTPCYGLCLQGLKSSQLHTNLLPKEIVTDRLIREKKPWAVAAAAAILLGCMVNYLGHWISWNGAHPDRYDAAFREATTVKSTSDGFLLDYDEASTQFTTIDTVGRNLVGNVDRRQLWLELLKTVDEALPADPLGQKPKEIGLRKELHIEQMDCEHFEDLNLWFQGISAKYNESRLAHASTAGASPTADEAAPAEGGLAEGATAAEGGPAEGASAEGDVAATGEGATGEEGEPVGPEGPGWVIQLQGYHYHNEDRNNQGAAFVRRTFLERLENGSVMLPDENGQRVEESMRDLGIGYPVLVDYRLIRRVEVPDEERAAELAAAAGGALGGGDGVGGREGEVGPLPGAGGNVNADGVPMIGLRRFDFVVQFVWKATPASARAEARRLREQERAASGLAFTSDGSE